MHEKDTALLLIDLQNDFCPGGRLAVPGGDEVIQYANQLQAQFHHVIATQEWHPADHKCFVSHYPDRAIYDVIDIDGIPQILWPEHCVQGSKGAEFHPDLQLDHVTKVFHKGIDKDIHSYSPFFDHESLRATGLADYLRELGIGTLFIMGLATDYCVKYAALDARKCGFTVYVILDACRGVELHVGDVAKAVEEMRAAGAHITTLENVKSQLATR